MTKEEAFVDERVKVHGRFLIPILQDIQETYNYLPEEIIRVVADKLEMPCRDVYGVATFYRSFSFVPKGKHVLTVCVGTACHVRGSTRMADALSRELNILPGETTEDKNFSLETVNCLGCCAIGPIVVADGEYHGEMTTQKAIKIVKDKEGGTNE